VILNQLKLYLAGYDNSGMDAFYPEWWANESLAILENNMVAAQMVHRDFSPIVANFGDIVNTRRPGEFQAKRKTVADNVTIQDAVATNVQVPLNQHIHTSFIVKDGEMAWAFKDLVEVYIQPAMLSIAQIVDQIICAQAVQFLGNARGTLGGLTSSNAIDYILSTREILNVNKAYMDGRNLLVSPYSETAMLKNEAFTSAEKVGDGGTALKKAWLGQKLGFDIWMDQNVPSPRSGTSTTISTIAINNGAGYPAGTATVVIDGAGATAANIRVGSWVNIAGSGVPHRVTALTGGPPYTGMTVSPVLANAVVDDAVISVATDGAVNLAAGYAAGYSKEIAVDAFTVAPQIGQFVTFGTDTNKYVVLQATTTSILLDRPLVNAIADDAQVHLGPAGSYNLAFHKNAIALVNRPLPMPSSNLANAAQVSYNNISMRAVMTYDGDKQGHLVTLDLLLGVAILDTNLGAVLLG